MLILARNGLDTPPDSHSDHFTEAGYGLQVYMKTAFCMRWLVAVLGPQKFDMAIKDYFKKWAFRHPYPEDFEAVMRENGVDIGWFMQQVQARKHTDYRLKKAETAHRRVPVDRQKPRENSCAVCRICPKRWQLGLSAMVPRHNGHEQGAVSGHDFRARRFLARRASFDIGREPQKRFPARRWAVARAAFTGENVCAD